MHRSNKVIIGSSCNYQFYVERLFKEIGDACVSLNLCFYYWFQSSKICHGQYIDQRFPQ